MRRVVLLAAFFALGGCATATNPTTNASIRPASAAQSPDITAGLTRFVFSDWAGPAVPVWVYVPWSVDSQSAPVMVLMHGAKRTAAKYLSQWEDLAASNGFIIVAPEFTKARFPSAAEYNSGNVFEDEVLDRNPEERWSFSAIEPIFDVVTSALDSRQTHYTLYGHSAGSQFVHRFMFFKPNARIKRVLAANAGWYTEPTLDIAFPYGLANTGVTEDQLKAVLESDVVILLGDRDTDPEHSSLRRTDEANRQGPHRFARGHYFFRTAKERARSLGVEFGWQLREVEGVAHSNGGIARASGDLIE